MKKLLMTMVLAVFAFVQMSQAQLNGYTFTSSNGTYTEITGGTVLITGTTNLDSWVSPAVTIPSFTFGSVAYTTAYVTSNGVLNLGGSAPSAYTTTAISSTTGSGISICPFNADLNGANSDANTEIRWETIGNEVIFQWKQFRRYNKTENFDMQVRLNTVTGTVSFVYQLNSGPATTTSYQPQVGIRTSATDFKNRLVSNTGAEDWNTSLPGTLNTDVCRFTIDAPQKNFITGLTYTWAPPTCPGIATGSFTTTNPTTSSVNMAWTEAGTATSWQIQYGLQGFTFGTGTSTVLNTNPYTLGGLSAATVYQIYIRSICAVGDTSTWKGPFVFTTSQVLATLPFSETFETWPNGWSTLNGGQTNKWSVGTAVANAGLKSAYISNDAGTTNAYTLASASVVHMYRDITFPAGTAFNLQFNWQGAGESTYDYMRVYLIPTTTTPVSGTLLTALQIGSTNYNQQATWQNANIELNGATYSSQNWRLVFTWKNDNGGGTQPPIAIDNISITAVACPAPVSPNALNLGTNSVDLAWTEAGTATSWQIQYGVTGFTLGTGTSTVVNANPYTLGGLTAATTYQFYVRSICSVGDTSAWAGPVTFTTPCLPLNVPYFEGFESITANNTLPNCMTATSLGSLNLTYIASTTYNRIPKTGSKFASFKYAPNGNWFFFAPVQLTAGVSYDAGVWYIADGATGFTALNLAYGNAQNSGAMTQIATVANPTNTTYQQLNATFTPATTGIYYIGVQANGTSSTPWYLTIDDITLVATPTCPGVISTTFDASNPQPNSIDLTWSEPGTATSWQIQYGAPGFTLGTGTMVVANANTYTIGSLTPATTYQAYIRSICSVGDTSAWKGPLNFTTKCLVISAPFTEGFESTTAPQTCWTMWYQNTNPPSGNLMTHSLDQAYNGTRSFRFSSYSSGTPYQQYLSTPELNYTTDMELTFWYKRSSSGSETFAVGTSTDGTNWTWGTDVSDASATWKQYLTVVPVGTKYMAIQYKSDYQYYLYIDDFSIHAIPTCPGVTAASFAAANQTTNSVDLSWTEPGTATQWQIEYGTAGFTPGTGTLTLANANPYTLGGLISGTNYQAYIRSICAVGDTSLWKGPLAFSTVCGIYSAPIVQNFDAVTAPQLPICWTKIVSTTTTNANVTTSTSSYYSSPNSARFYNSSDAAATLMLVTPQINDAINTLYVKFFAYNTSAGSDLVIGTITDPANAATFSTIDTFNLTTTSTEYSLFLNGVTTTNKYIAFKHLISGTYNYVYLDDININVIPSCLWVENLDMDTANQTSAILSWTSLGSETQWQVEYGQAGFTQGTGTYAIFNSNPDTLFGLQASTMYDFYIRAICNAGDTSTWAGPKAFGTECGIFSLPFNEDFTGIATGSIPLCWGRTHQNWGVISDNLAGGTAPEMRFNWSPQTIDTLVLITPVINATAATSLYLSFKHTVDHYAGDPCAIGVTVSIDGGLNWDSVWAFIPTVDVIEEVVNIDLSAYAGHNIIVGWAFVGDTYDIDYWYIDNIVIDEIPDCDVPTALNAINLTATTADLTWTGGTSFEWEIEWDTTGFTQGTGNVLFTATKPITITGLAPEATYEFYVRANCLFDSTVWAGPFEFTTTATCVAPDSLDTVSVTHDAAVISWYSADTLWQIEWDTAGFVLGTGNVVVTENNPYTISGLDELTAYDFYIRAICDTLTGDTSAWAGPLTFITTTTIGLKNVKTEMNVNIYPNPTNGLFNIQMLSSTESLHLSILNLQGQIVYEEQLSGVANGSIKKLDLRTLAAGMYQIKLNDGKTILNKKLIIN